MPTLNTEELLAQKKKVTEQRQEKAVILNEMVAKDGFSKEDAKKSEELGSAISLHDEQLQMIDNLLNVHGQMKAKEVKVVKGAPTLSNTIRAFLKGGTAGISDAQKDYFRVDEPGAAGITDVPMAGGDEDSLLKASQNGEGISLIVRPDMRNGLRNAAQEGGGANDPSGAMVSIPAQDGNDSSASEVVYEEHGVTLIDKLLSFGGLRQMVRTFKTSRGNVYPFPQSDTTMEEGAIVAGEGTQTDSRPVAGFTNIDFGAYLYTSHAMPVTYQALQDSFISLEPYTISRGMRRIGRIFNRHGTNGTGVSEPQGIKVIARDGKVAARTGEINFNELVDLEHSIEYAYREGMEAPQQGDYGLSARDGRLGFMVHDSFVRIMKNLKDNDGRPLWLPSITMGMPATILGYPYSVNQNLDTVAANAIPALFGNFGYYAIRDVLNIIMFRYTDSNYSSKFCVGFQMFMRCDARGLGPFTNNRLDPVARFQMAAADPD